MKLQLQFCILLLIFTSLFNCSNDASKDCNSIEMHFEDIDNFWSAYDKIKTLKDHSERTKIIQHHYINKSSKGLKLLIKKDQLTASDYATFMKDTVFFNSIKSITLNSKKDTSNIRSHLRDFEKLYPDAQFNDIYFVMGQFKRAGTVIDSTMIIQLEKNARSEHTKSAFLFNDDQLKNINHYESLIPLVVHEQVHVNQKNINTRTLLSKSICEGSADFLMYLQTGKLPSSLLETYAYGKANESSLWVKFLGDLDIKYQYIKTDWFYNYDRTDIPPDLGYFMGFKICEKFYNDAKDKHKAIAFMLDSSNSEKLLELSNYNGGL
ncbi:gliding motility protein GldB-related protein [Psychroserpens sp. MEBiC05023]